MAECGCWPTPVEQHYVYYGITEPGSAMEFNPDCPVHGYDTGCTEECPEDCMADHKGEE